MSPRTARKKEARDNAAEIVHGLTMVVMISRVAVDTRLLLRACEWLTKYAPDLAGPPRDIAAETARCAATVLRPSLAGPEGGRR